MNDHAILKIGGRIQGYDHQLELRWYVGKERDILSDNASYTLRSTKNDYCQRNNLVRYFSSFCRMEWKKKTRNGRKFPIKHKY